MKKTIILNNLQDEKVLDKIFDAALKHPTLGGSAMYNAIAYIEKLVVISPEKIDKEAKKETEANEQPAEEIAKPKKEKSKK